MSPLDELNNKFETLIQRLPAGWEELAVKTHAFSRARQLKSPKDLLRAVFSYAVADYSLREVAAVLTREQKWMTDQAVYARLSKSVLWLETLLAALFCDKAKRVAVQSRCLKIVDATTLNCPAARGTDYRLHLCYEPLSQASCGVKLTDVTGAERFTHFEYEPMDIVLGDRLFDGALIGTRFRFISSKLRRSHNKLTTSNYVALKSFTKPDYLHKDRLSRLGHFCF
jgi:hypothetical protein